MCRNTGEFMMSRYRDVAEIILRYLEHRDRLVCLSITSLLPRIAHFLYDQFVTNYLMICMNHILYVLKIPAERASGFIALGEMASALDGELINYLLIISSHMRDAVMLYMSLQMYLSNCTISGEICFSQIAPRRGRTSLEALACVGNIAKAMGTTMEPHVHGLLDSIFFGLSLTLVDALDQITESILPLLPTIQNRLLEFISTILSRSHHSMPRQSASGYDLLEFARESVVVYLEDEDGGPRKDVVMCCCKLVANSFSAIYSTQFSPSRINRASGKRRHRVVEEVLMMKISALCGPVGSKGKLHIRGKAAFGLKVMHGNFFPGKPSIFEDLRMQ
ncbi:Serine/threonine-protein kinase TOR [Capsicum baccatum]|uniref:Serine/threonine-protein kinase TOR n=1 Tax=Capsicum baccatum TaxID=33114 RepID=A0A2G2VC75_CAPBA|nr:Serine/threonine-protein kinase TOR [Capsicum baccatum]